MSVQMWPDSPWGSGVSLGFLERSGRSNVAALSPCGSPQTVGPCLSGRLPESLLSSFPPSCLTEKIHIGAG